jgi:hypothetical protein
MGTVHYQCPLNRSADLGVKCEIYTTLCEKRLECLRSLDHVSRKLLVPP